MAIVVRYFSTAAAGAGDGTTWADRAQLVSGATWSTVLTGFDFSAANSLECRIGPGTHSPTALLQASLFTNAPRQANPLIIHGCDSSGVRLDPPDPDWTADRALFDDSGFPVIATTTNIVTSNLSWCLWRCVKLTGSGANGFIQSVGNLDWCSIINSTSNTAAKGTLSSRNTVTNCQIQMTGSSYDYGLSVGVSSISDNIKVVGVAGSAGNRDGILWGSSNESSAISRCCVSGVGGIGIRVGETNAGMVLNICNSVVANCAGGGIQFASTAAQTRLHRVNNCCITGNTGYGINAQSASALFLANCRLRDNSSGNFNGLLNYPDDLYNYTTDSDDATEYMNAASNDFQSKTGLAWGDRSIGISQQAAAGGGALHLGSLGQTGIGSF